VEPLLGRGGTHRKSGLSEIHNRKGELLWHPCSGGGGHTESQVFRNLVSQSDPWKLYFPLAEVSKLPLFWKHKFLVNSGGDRYKQGYSGFMWIQNEVVRVHSAT